MEVCVKHITKPADKAMISDIRHNRPNGLNRHNGHIRLNGLGEDGLE